jgi:hypothetical protein
MILLMANLYNLMIPTTTIVLMAFNSRRMLMASSKQLATSTFAYVMLLSTIVLASSPHPSIHVYSSIIIVLLPFTRSDNCIIFGGNEAVIAKLKSDLSTYEGFLIQDKALWRTSLVSTCHQVS